MRLTPRTPRILIVPTGRHEGAGSRSVNWIICGRVRENVILTCTRPCTRLILAREAGAATRDRDRRPAKTPADPVDLADVEEPPDSEPVPDEVPCCVVVPAAAGGVDGTLVTGGSVGAGGRGTVGAGTVGAGAVGAGTVGAGTVGAGRLGVVTVGTVTVGTVTVGTETVGAGNVGTVTVGRAAAGFAAPTACAATSPRTGRATAASTMKLRSPNARIHSSNGRTPQRDTAEGSRPASRNGG